MAPEEIGDAEKSLIDFYEEVGLILPSWEAILRDLKNRLIYGAYEGDELVSFTSGIILEDLPHVAHVYTSPKFRKMGYATSTCSALVGDLLKGSEEAILFVFENNPAAIKVYAKIGFSISKHKFLTFQARRIG